MFDGFSEDATKLVALSRQAAEEFGHDYVGTEHLLLGIVAADGTVASTVLQKLGIDAARVRAGIKARVFRGVHVDETDQTPFTTCSKRVVDSALEESQKAGHRHIGTGHMLLGLFSDKTGLAAAVLGELGLTLDETRPVVMDVIPSAIDSSDGPPIPALPVIGGSLWTAIGEARAEAQRLGHASADAEHALIVMLLDDGVAARVLRELGATPEGIRKRVLELRGE